MVKKTKLLRLYSFTALVLVLFACNPTKRLNKDFNYFQKGLDSALVSTTFKEPKIAAGDNITIQVIAGSLSQQDASLFNLTGGSMATTGATGASASSSSGGSGASYQVDKDGYIIMSKLGKIKAEGYSKQEFAIYITNKLTEGELVKDPLVVVKLSQFRVNVLGEVKKPGTVFFKNEKTNILEVIAEAGDLTDFGKREDVVIMRQDKEKWVTYKMNLKNTDFFKSEAFYLKNNDVVYVGANDVKLKTLKINPNFQKDVSFVSTALQTLFFVLQAFLIIRSFR